MSARTENETLQIPPLTADQVRQIVNEELNKRLLSPSHSKINVFPPTVTTTAELVRSDMRWPNDTCMRWPNAT